MKPTLQLAVTCDCSFRAGLWSVGDPQESAVTVRWMDFSRFLSLEGMMLKLKLQYFGHLMRRIDSLEKTLMPGGIGGRCLTLYNMDYM